MREIEFRGKCLKTDGWAYGMPLESQFDCTYMITRQGGMKADFIYSRYTIKDYEDRIAVATETVGQYTGLKDKKGIKIYEGDVVSFDIETDDEFGGVFIGVVSYISELAGYIIQSESNGYTLNSDVEIIGNIHENKGLLKQ